MNSTASTLILLLGTLVLSADDRPRDTTMEQGVREALETENRAAFFEMFYSPAGEAREREMREDMSEMFARHFRSGHGGVIVIPLNGDAYRKETMGWMATDGLRRAPGPPFAYLELYPADKNDPDYMGLSMRLARIDGEVRIVYPEVQKDVPEFLAGKLSRWKRVDGTEFRAQFVRIDGGKAHFRTDVFRPLEVDLEDLSPKDRTKIEKLAEETEGAE